MIIYCLINNYCKWREILINLKSQTKCDGRKHNMCHNPKCNCPYAA